MDESLLKTNWPVLIFAVLVLAVNLFMIVFSYFIGERHRGKKTDEIYESGIGVTGDARLRFPAHFYIIALFFVIFDIEAVFIVLWALVFKETGWFGYWGMFAFIMILLVVLIYEWKTGALDFGPKGKKILKAHQARKQKEKG